MGQRLASAGDRAGLTAGEIVGLSAALASTGIEVEAGGSAISRVLKSMESAAISGGDQLKKLSIVAGTDFKKAFQEDADVAFTAFIRGLQNIRQSGGDVNETLKALGFGELRVSDALGRLSKNADKLKESFDRGNKSFAEGTALAEEAGKRYETFESQMKMLWNTISIGLDVIGSQLAPKLKFLVEILAGVVDAFVDLSPKTQEFIVNLGIMTASLGPLALAISAGLAGLAMLATVLGGPVVLGIAGATAGFVALGTIMMTWGDEIYNLLAGAGASLVDFFSYTVPNAFIDALNGLTVLTNNIITRFQQAIEFGIKPFAEALEFLTGKTIKTDFAMPQLKEFEYRVKATTEEIKKTGQEGEKTGGTLQKAYDKMKAGAKGLLGGVGDVNAEIDKLGKGGEAAAKKAKKEQEKLKKALEETEKAAKKASDSIVKQIKSIKDEAENLDIKNALDKAIREKNEPEIEKWKQALKAKTKEGIIEGFVEAGGSLPMTEFDYQNVDILAEKKVEQTIDTLNEKLEKGMKKGFLQDLPDFLSKSISDAVISGFDGGFNAESVKGGLKSVSQLFVNSFQESINGMFGKDGTGFTWAGAGEGALALAGAWGSNYLSSIYGATNENGVRIRTDGAMGAGAGAATGAAIGTQILPGWGTAIGAVVGGAGGFLMSQQGASSSGSISREETQRWIEERLANAYLPFLTEQGNIHYGDDRRWSKPDSGNFFSGLPIGDMFGNGPGVIPGEIVGGPGGTRNPLIGQGPLGATPGFIQTTDTMDWTDQFWEMSGEVGQAFHSMGMVVEGFAGNAGENFGQLGVILYENLNGNLDNARLMMQTLGIDAEAYTQKLMEMGMQGKFTWHEIEVALQRTEELTGKGLVGVGDLVGAFEQFRNSAGRGAVSLTSLRNIMVEATDLGIKNFDQLRASLIAQGVSVEDVDRLFQSFAQRGINSMEDFQAANDRTLGGVTADMQSLGFEWNNIEDGIKGTNQSLEQMEKRLDRIESKDVDVNIRINYKESNKPPVLENADGNVFDFNGLNRNYTAFAKGGIVSSPTFFDTRLGLAGEAGPEGILPLKRMLNGQLGVQSDGMGGGFVINIDARGAAPGVEAQIIGAIRASQKQIIKNTMDAVYEMKRRGGL